MGWRPATISTKQYDPYVPRRQALGGLLGLTLFAATAVGAADRPSLSVAPLATAPVIDGELTEAEWSDAAVWGGYFVQVEPEFGQPSPFRTVVRIGQTSATLYVAFESYDPDPDRLATAMTRRDGAVGDDDAVAVLLDTFADGRTAYAFATNALATQWDARVADNARTIDEVWDAAWSCASQRHADRWIVEFEIPFGILRFDPGTDRTWGLNLARTIPRRLEESLWSGPAESFFRVSSFGTLTGLDLGAREEKPWQVIPYGLAAAAAGEPLEGEIGGDLRFRPSRAVAVDLTVNPDFAIIEADVEVINLSRFELFIPEKRPFFLEGSEMYRQRIRQFYSRRIGDITVGAKGTGTVSKTDFSAIVTSEDQVLEGSEDGVRAGYAVGRLQRTLPGGSTVGFLGATRRRDGVDQGSVGLDATLFFNETLGFTGQLLRVHGPTAQGGLAWFVRPAYDSAKTHFHLRYTNLDPDIREDFNAAGFLRDDDRREFDTNFTRSFWIQSGAVEKVQARANYNRFYSHDGTLRTWELDAELELTFRNGIVVELERIDDYQLFEKGFRNDRTVLEVGWDGRDGRSVRAFAGRGVNFDSDLTLYGASAGWVVGDAWRLAYSLTRLELDPDPDGDTTWIHVFETDYAFNPDLFVKFFAQTNSAIDKVNVQAVGVWRFKPPFGSLQLAYQRGTSETGAVSTQGDTIFVKLSWVLSGSLSKSMDSYSGMAETPARGDSCSEC